jgi:hypothetical protein
MPKKILKIAYRGIANSKEVDLENDLLLRIISRVSGSEVQVVDSIYQADLILAYPYESGRLFFRLKWIFATLFKKKFGQAGATILFKWLIGASNKPVIFVSHENLDRPYWWKTYGNFLISSDVPRLTFWPKNIDPFGARFPYWYNYINWDSYPRRNFYTRYGKLYDLDKLMSPLHHDATRDSNAVMISSHLDFPRAALLKNIKTNIKVDVYGGAGLSFDGPKYDLMTKYRYAFCPENSVGYGYDTEKIPEAWIAGCIPLGIYLNPFSEFNSEIVGLKNYDLESAHQVPLLLKKPTLIEIEEYIEKVIRQYDLSNTYL